MPHFFFQALVFTSESNEAGLGLGLLAGVAGLGLLVVAGVAGLCLLSGVPGLGLLVRVAGLGLGLLAGVAGLGLLAGVSEAERPEKERFFPPITQKKPRG